MDRNDPPIIPSTHDFRAELSPMRHSYRVLTEDEKTLVEAIKDQGQAFLDLISHRQSREMSIARTKIEEAVMWAVKDVTR